MLSVTEISAYLICYRAGRRYTPADHGGSTSVRGQIRIPHSSGGLQGSCDAAGLGAAARLDTYRVK